MQRIAAGARLRDLAGDPRRLAAGRRARRRRCSDDADRRHDRLRRCRHHHLRLRRHLYRRRGADRRASGRATAPCAAPRRWRASRSTPSSCPTSTCCRRITKAYVEGVIDRSLRRLGMERLDLVQFHWWDYDACRAGWRPRAGWTSCAQAGKIDKYRRHQFRHRADARRSSTPACRSPRMQVQYSLLDDRPAKAHGGGRRGEHGVSLLCYGTVAGGFLGDALARRSRSRSSRSRTAR